MLYFCVVSTLSSRKGLTAYFSVIQHYGLSCMSQFSKNYDHLMHVSNTSYSLILCSECTVKFSGSGVNEGTGSTTALCICCVKYRY